MSVGNCCRTAKTLSFLFYHKCDDFFANSTNNFPAIRNVNKPPPVVHCNLIHFERTPFILPFTQNYHFFSVHSTVSLFILYLLVTISLKVNLSSSSSKYRRFLICPFTFLPDNTKIHFEEN